MNNGERLDLPASRSRAASTVSLVLIALLACSSSKAYADEPESTDVRPALFHPDGPGEYRLRFGAGLLLDILPRSLVEAELRQALRVAVSGRLGLPYGFSIDLAANGIVLYNEALLGVSWSVSLSKHVSMRATERFGAWYGFVPLSGFDTAGWGLLQVPGVAIGLRYGPHRFTLSADLYLTSAHRIAFGDADVLVRVTRVAGAALGFTVESPAFGAGSLYYAVELFYTTQDYQLWLVFADSQARSLYPRFLLGYAF